MALKSSLATNAIPIGIIRANRWPYLVINVIYYGLIVCGMIVAALYPPLQQIMLARMHAETQSALLAPVVRAYMSGNIPLAALLTFLVNSAATFVQITLLSALIPFSGLMVCTRAVEWGLALSPTTPRIAAVMLPHSLTLLLEGQGYILAMFGCYLSGKWFLRPGKYGFATRRDGYVAGLRVNLRMYPLIVAVLAVAAGYEASEVVAVATLVRH